MAEPPRTIAASLARSVAAHSEEPALDFIRGGELRWRGWREVADEAAQLASAIQAAGIEHGGRFFDRELLRDCPEDCAPLPWH